MANFERAVAKAYASIKAQGVPEHVHSQQCTNILRQVLHKDERIVLEAKQSHWEGITPSRIVATNKRLIMVRPSFWGLHTGHDLFTPTNYEIIPYQYIQGVTVARGKAFDSIKVHHTGTSGPDQEMHTHSGDEFNGIPRIEARAMSEFVEEVIEYGPDAQERTEQPQAQEESPPPWSKELSLEDAKSIVNERGARFLWLGIDPVEQVAQLLDIPTSKVAITAPVELVNSGKEGVRKHGADILLSYEGEMANHVARVIKQKYGLEMYTLRGGLKDVAKRLHKEADAFK